MNIKFKITKELIEKYHSVLQTQLGTKIENVNIVELHKQYSFEFVDPKDNGRWHIELDKYTVGNGLFRLHCSKMILDIDLDSIKNLNRFCERIYTIIRMQIEYIKKNI